MPGSGHKTPKTAPTAPAPRYRMPWAELLQKVFAVDVLLCPDCGGRLRVLACLTMPEYDLEVPIPES